MLHPFFASGSIFLPFTWFFAFKFSGLHFVAILNELLLRPDPSPIYIFAIDCTSIGVS